jgi:acyl carrier protein
MADGLTALLGSAVPSKLMSTELLETRVYRVISDLFNVPAESLTPASSAETIELWDSIGHLNLVLALEEEFGIRFSPDQADNMINVDSILHTLRGA